HEILPALRSRWPGLDQSVVRSAQLSKAAANELEQTVRLQLTGDRPWGRELDATRLLGLSPFLQGEAIRVWSRALTGSGPSGPKIDEFLDQLLNAGDDRQPQLEFDGHAIRLWQQKLWLIEAEPSQAYRLDWCTDQPLSLPFSLGRISLSGPKEGTSLHLQVRSGEPGDRLKLGSDGHRKVKELMREGGIPPWQRASWPRIERDGRLIAVGSRWLEPKFQDWMQAHSFQLHWVPLESLPGAISPNATHGNH
ncbi:MAG: tRNA lysidine(34) synthetase TilS, partial [Pseudomonadota bacterium]